jgi:hypothetical protein
MKPTQKRELKNNLIPRWSGFAIRSATAPWICNPKNHPLTIIKNYSHYKNRKLKNRKPPGIPAWRFSFKEPLYFY